MNATAWIVELVGGPYDGAPDLTLLVHEGAELPDHVWVFTCRRGEGCGRPHRKRAHTWIAVEREDGAPRALRYELHEQHAADAFMETLDTAIYARGSVDELWRQTTQATLPSGVMA